MGGLRGNRPGGAWLLFEAQASERTGLRRELYLSNGFVGHQFRPEVSAGISLDFLDDDERLPRERFSFRWRGYSYVLDGGPIEGRRLAERLCR